MKEDFLSLALYTVIAQSAAGAFIFSELFGKVQNTGKKKRNITILLILLIVAAGISFLHLGNSAHAINAINNLRTSWLSREILLMCLLIVAMPVYSSSLDRNSYMTVKVIKYISTALALLFLFSMMMLYMLPSIRSWYHPTTPVSFFLTSAICGIMTASIMDGSDADLTDNRYTILIAIFVFASLINSSIYFVHVNYPANLLLFFRMISPLCALIILITKKIRCFSNNSGLWSVIAIGLLFTGELTGRIMFFLSIERSGL